VAASGLLSTEMTGGDQNGGGGLEGGAMGIGSNASDGGRRSSGKGSLIRMLASGLTLFVLAPAGVRAQESVSEADCEAAIQTTADDYQSGRTPDPETEQLARDCTTPVSEGPIGETKVTTTKSGLRGTSCKTIHVGYGYTNGFGQLITALFGHLNWCYNGKKVQSGSFWDHRGALLLVVLGRHREGEQSGLFRRVRVRVPVPARELDLQPSVAADDDAGPDLGGDGGRQEWKLVEERG
jgi:hypothetical protein